MNAFVILNVCYAADYSHNDLCFDLSLFFCFICLPLFHSQLSLRSPLQNQAYNQQSDLPNTAIWLLSFSICCCCYVSTLINTSNSTISHPLAAFVLFRSITLSLFDSFNRLPTTKLQEREMKDSNRNDNYFIFTLLQLI